MKPSTKVFSILSLSTAIGGILAKSKDETKTAKEIEALNWRGQKLFEAGFTATNKYPFPCLTDSKVRQIEKKVDEICQSGTDFEIVETLSFLLCGLEDILIKTNSRNADFINPVITRTLWVQELFDSKLSTPDVYAKAVQRFEGWAA